jgi:hypothetical protein
MTTNTRIAACLLVLAAVVGGACTTPPGAPGGTTTTTIALPPINPVVADHDFESSSSGWIPYLTGSGGPLTDRENLNFSTVLGPFPGHPTGGAVVGQRFPLSGNQDHVLISFDFAEIDSWDDEQFKVWVDGQLVISDRYEKDRLDLPSGVVAVAGPSGRQNLGYGRWSDQIVRYTLSVPTTGGSVLVEFGANLGSALSDESWAIDNFELRETRGGGVAEHRDISFDLSGSTLETYDTPFGAGNFTAPIGPGTITMRLPVDAGSGLITDGPVEILAMDLQAYTVNTIGIIGATVTNDGRYQFTSPNPTGSIGSLTAAWANPTAGLRSFGTQSCSGSCGQVPADSLGPYDDTRAVDLGAFRFAATPDGVQRSFTSDWTLVNTTSNSKTRIRLAGSETGPGAPGPSGQGIFEDFEDGDTTGWINAELDSSWPSFTQFLGRFGGSGGAQVLSKVFPLSGTQSSVTVQFDFYEIDSWDGLGGNEYFVAFIDDTQVLQDWFDHRVTEDPMLAEPVLGGAGNNLGFTAWADQTYRYTLTVPTTSTQLKLGFGARLGPGGTGGGGSDESWGIDNVRIVEQ